MLIIIIAVDTFVVFIVLALLVLLLAAAVSHVELEGDTVVAYGEVELPHRIVAAATVEVGVRVVRVDLDDPGEVADGLLVLAEALIGYPAVMQGVYVLRVQLHHPRVVPDGLLVVAQLREAVGTVIKGLEVVRRPILNLRRIVLDGLLETLQLSVYQAPVRVDDGVLTIEEDRPIEVLARTLHLAHVTIAAGSVMPVDGVPPVEVDGSREILDGLLEVEEAVPDEPPPVVGGRVGGVQGEDLVEGVQGQGQPVATQLLPDCTQVMQG